MKIAICGSMKFLEDMLKTKSALERLGHKVFIPEPEEGDNGMGGSEMKKKYNYIRKHMDLIEKSDAILVVNVTKKEVENYIGANTFLEMGYAYYRKKKIFVLNPLPEQPYIIDELLTFNPVVLDGDLTKIK